MARQFFENIGLMLVIVITGKLVSLFALPPFNSSPLWLPAGIAIGAVLVRGFGLLPAVFVGNLLLALNLADYPNEIMIIAASWQALCAVILVVLAHFLLKKFQLWPDPLIRHQRVILFFLACAILAPLIPSLLLGLMPSQSEQVLLQPGWHRVLAIWIANTVGIIIATPIVLSLFALPRSLWQPRILTVSLPLLCLFTATLVLVEIARDRDQALNQTRFAASVAVVNIMVENELNYHRALLQAMRAYFSHSQFVTESEFEHFANDYSAHHHDISYMGWIRPHALEQTVHSGPVIQYVSDKQQGDNARLQGQALCDGQNVSVCDQLTQAEVLLVNTSQMLPSQSLGEGVYSYLAAVKKNDQSDTLGWVMQTINYQTLFADLYQRLPNSWVEFSVHNLNDGITVFSSDMTATAADFSRDDTRIVNQVGQHWQIDYRPSELFLLAYGSSLFDWTATIVLLLFGLTTVWLLVMTGRLTLVAEEVADKTRELKAHGELLEESEAKYRRLVENIQDEYFLYSHDKNGVFRYISPSISAILGYSQDEFLTHYSRYMPDTELNRQVAALTEQTLSGHKSNYELEIFSKGGKLHTLAVTEMPSYDDNGDIIGVEGLARDVTEFKVSQQKLEKLSLAIEHSPNAVLIMDKYGRVEYVNPKFTTITGFSNDETLGKWPDLINSGINAPGIYDEIWHTIHQGHEWRGELQNRKKNGDLYWAQELIAPMMNEAGEVTHFVATQVDITEARRLSEETSYQAKHDQLTGLINRHEFDLRLNRVIQAAKHNMTEHALCFLDLDQFKLINDTCGHIAGDEMLRQVGSLLQGNVRSRDTIARLGGDEFGILMEHCGIDQAYEACEQILNLLQEFRFHWQDYTFTIGGSIGLAIIDQHTADATEALRNVDTACYSAKDAGRNRVEVHREDSLRLQQRRGEIQWSTEISEALDDDRFVLYAQAIKPLADPDQAISYEILLRMLRKDGELSPPGAFMPAAERYNSITRIDRWVVTHTLNWLTANAQHLNQVATISINLSGLTLSDETMLHFIIDALEQGDIPAEKIKFEITETAAIANLVAATHFIEALGAYGIRFALDDFGSGLSSFAYLKKLKVDSLKIDGMFVKDMLNDPLDLEMVKSINEIGHVMGLKTIAEFVDKESTLSKLREIGVDYVQGYAIGKPMPIDDILLS